MQQTVLRLPERGHREVKRQETTMQGLHIRQCLLFLLKIIIIALIMNLMTCIRCKSVLPGKLNIFETILHAKKLLS